MNLPNLAAEMTRHEVSDDDIAAVSNRTVKTVQNWFKGIGEPSYSQAKAIRDKCFPGMDIEYLFDSSVAKMPKAS